MKALIIYWSKTGNTEKVAQAIKQGMEAVHAEVRSMRLEEAEAMITSETTDFYAYDVVCFGFPSYRWSPPKPVDQFLNEKYAHYRKQGRVKVGAPKVPGKHVLIFCTYSGPHTGINEAIPAGKYAGQFFEHLGFTVVDEWYVVGEFHGSEESSTLGRLGDIRGRPNAQDLEKVREDAMRLARELS
jgi:multimeric flavodoxin WrbA